MNTFKQFLWTEPAPPDGGVTSYYDHVMTSTPLGDFIIEWKSWKQWDSYCLYFNGEYVDALVTLEEAKDFAHTWLSCKVQECFKEKS